jgi:hypothetical protein
MSGRNKLGHPIQRAYRNLRSEEILGDKTIRKERKKEKATPPGGQQ